MQYKVIEAFDPYAGPALTNKVNEHLAEGWTLHGQMCVVHDKDKVKLYQTMVKEENNV